MQIRLALQQNDLTAAAQLAEQERNSLIEQQSSPAEFVTALLELPHDSLDELIGADLIRRFRSHTDAMA